ncbi:Bug family tripartite tricarboxylate transporter substrate binding protein [Roseomonas sp. BN140053]|uniref:Bug family tripartite tricarboxylate transporter substrate binding protein n=1 Tax=Roseomonas sp. BN140053 TaxID=3391898 RepID=UPI0039EC0DF9
MLLRRTALLGGLFGALGSADARAQAGPYPSRPIRLVLPYATGGAADALARAVGEHLREQLGQPVVVDSRPGANSQLGAELVARAPKDGYTLLYVGWPTISINTVLNRNPPYRPEDFQPITPLFRTPTALAVKPDSAIRDFDGVVAAARAAGSLAYGTTGIGSSSHLLMARQGERAGVTLQNVPYRGEAPIMTDVIAGHLPLYVGSVSTALEQHRAGTLRIIGTTAPERLPVLPDVSTFREQGHGEMVFTYWHGVVAPAGVPAPVLAALHAGFTSAMRAPGVLARLSPDFTPFTLEPDAFAALIRDDIATWEPVIRANRMMLE